MVNGNLSQKPPIISRMFLVVFSIVFILPIGLFGAYVGQCKIRQFSAKNSKQAQIDTFENTKIVSSDTSKANVYLGGDCVDSSPYVQVDKTVVPKENAAATVAEIRKTLTTQSYSLSDEGIYRRVGIDNTPCGYRYGATAEGNDISFKVWFSTYNSQSLPAKCGATGEVEVMPTEIAGEEVHSLMARLN